MTARSGVNLMQETHVTGRTLRDQSKHSLNYMLVTLGIEKDDDSDEDFVLDYMEEDNEEEEDLPFSVSDAEITQKAAPLRRKHQKQNRNAESVSKSTRTIDTQPRQGNQKRATDTQHDGPLPKQQKKDTLYEPFNGGDSGYDENVGEYDPRMRASAHLEEVQLLGA
ncbi:hypothetical protein PInf_020012 [Phytophthora infestans]|nr:hypothetical protein PInf_020012 [Phytophthora infestans]